MNKKLVGLSMVRNESDVIETFIRHNLTLLDELHIIGNFISYSKKGRYACIYVDENRIDSIVADLKKKKFVKKIEISEMSDLHLSFENFDNKLDNTR